MTVKECLKKEFDLYVRCRWIADIRRETRKLRVLEDEVRVQQYRVNALEKRYAEIYLEREGSGSEQ